MVGGAAGGVHRGARGRPRYAQVRGTVLRKVAADLGWLAGFQPGLFPIVLPLLCPLFLRALCCTARGMVMRFSARLSMVSGDKSVFGVAVAPALSLYLHCYLQPNAAVQPPCGG